MALLSGGGQAEYVTVPEGHLIPVPNDMSLVQAAAIPEAWLTAFQLLHFVGERCICKSIPFMQFALTSFIGLLVCSLLRPECQLPLESFSYVSLDLCKSLTFFVRMSEICKT